ncbi:MAG: hypothetical protein V8S95_04280 [Odoribacter sp.]
MDNLSHELRHKANTETSQQRKNEALQTVASGGGFPLKVKEVNKPKWDDCKKHLVVILSFSRPLVPFDRGRFCHFRFLRFVPSGYHPEQPPAAFD